MKPAPFEYIRADSIEETCAVLQRGGEDALVLAGGQSLMPLLALRLARPSLLVDINEVAELKGINATDAVLEIRAGTRQTAALRSEVLCKYEPLLAKAIAWVGHEQTRNRGTLGGSLALADPAAEIPLAATVLNADLVVRQGGTKRQKNIEDFFLGPMVTTLSEEDLLVSLKLPIWIQSAVGTSFKEISARKGDFAIVSVAAQIALDPDGRCERAAIGAGNAGPKPIRLAQLEASLIGQWITPVVIEEVVESIDAELDPPSDLRASAGYRTRVLKTLLAQSISEANEEARQAI